MTKRILVARGVKVTPEEFAERYGHLDLDAFKEQVTPEVYRAFVAHIGAISGPKDIDVNELMECCG